MTGALRIWLKPANLMLVILALGLVSGAWMWRLGDPAFLTAVRNFTFDTYQRIKPREPLGQPIRIIDIDEDAIAKYGQWPWPRSRMAQMVDRLRELGAAVVVFDIVFSEPDPNTPANLVSRLGKLDGAERSEAERLLSGLPDGDKELAEAISSTTVVTGFFNQSLSRAGLPADKSGEAVLGNAPLDEILPPIVNSVKNLPAIEDAAAGNGSITLSEQTDDLIRKVPMFLRGGGKNYPALSIEAIRVALGERGYVLKTTTAGTEISAGSNAMVSFRIGQLEVPVTEDGSLLIYYAHTPSDLTVPAVQLLEGEDETIRERIDGNFRTNSPSRHRTVARTSPPTRGNVAGFPTFPETSPNTRERVVVDAVCREPVSELSQKQGKNREFDLIRRRTMPIGRNLSSNVNGLSGDSLRPGTGNAPLRCRETI